MSTFVLKRNYELQLPTSFVDVDRDEMDYIDGGWDLWQVHKNAMGLMAVAGMAYVGSAIQAFVRANRGISFGKAVVKLGGIAIKAFWVLPIWAKAIAAATEVSMVYALGTWDIF